MRKAYRKKIGLLMSLVITAGQLCGQVPAAEISPLSENLYTQQEQALPASSEPEETGLLGDQADLSVTIQAPADDAAANDAAGEESGQSAAETPDVQSTEDLHSDTGTAEEVTDTPAVNEPAAAETVDGQSSDGQDADAPDAESLSAESQGADGQTAEDQNAESQTTEDQNAEAQTTEEPAADSPAVNESAAAEAVDGQPEAVQNADAQIADAQIADKAPSITLALKAAPAAAPAEDLLLETVVNLTLSDESNPKVTDLFTRGVYWVAPQIIPEGMLDITDTFFYDDSLLTGDSLAYNQLLATMSFEMAVASISSEREDKTEEGYANKSRNLKAYLEDNGFIDFETNDDYREKMTANSMGAACAHKKIVDNGKTYTLLVIVPRSAGYEAEWGGNFMMGESGDHEGFSNSKDIILDFAKSYVQKYGIEGDIKVWTAGYSRGGGVTNQVGAALLRDPAAALGDSVVLTPENLYCYTFGTPGSAGTDGDYENAIYDYIHNTFELYDIVTSVPPTEFGFDRYGTNMGYASEDRKARMLELLKMTNETVYNAYMNGGDPDNFIPKTLDIEALLRDHTLTLADDKDSYLPGTQAEFLKVFAGSIAEAAKTRGNFYENYQTPLVNLAGYFFTHTDEWDALIGGIRDSDYAVPAAVSMYISLLAEKYSDNRQAETLQEIDDALAAMDQLLAEMQAQGIELDAQVLEEYSSLKAYVRDKALENQPGFIVDTAKAVSGFLYAKMAGDGLAAANADEETIAALTGEKDSRAMAHIFSYLLFADGLQEKTTNLVTLQEQMIEHAATFIGNAGSFLLPHYNEVIRSWLRTQDPRYDDFTKETNAQTAGYRRVYIENPEGADVTGTVRDSLGNVVAVFTNGKLISSTNDWIRITTCDTGNWLRLPVDDTYRIDFDISDDTVLNIKVTEYSVFDNEEVRTETSDSKYNWKEISLRTKDAATLVVSALDETDGKYTMGSLAAYYLDLLRRYSVTYILDGGVLNGASGQISQYYDDGTGITLPEPTREGYRFAYWEGSRYDAGDPYTVTADHIFRAIWEKISDAVTPPKPEEEQPAPDEEPETEEDEKPAGSEDNKPAGKEDDKPARTSAVTQTVSAAPAPQSSFKEVRAEENAAPLTGDETPIDMYVMLLGLSGMFVLSALNRKRVRRAE